MTLETFPSYLRRKYRTEKYISRLHNKHEKFLCKWSKLSHLLDVQMHKQKNKKPNLKKSPYQIFCLKVPLNLTLFFKYFQQIKLSILPCYSSYQPMKLI